MDRNEAIDILRVIAPPRTSKKAFYDFMEARDMAIKALEGKDIDVTTNSALDHIHNVVAEREYQRGYEQGKADAAISASTLAKRLTAKFDDVLSVADVLEELDILEAVAKGE